MNLIKIIKDKRVRDIFGTTCIALCFILIAVSLIDTFKSGQSIQSPMAGPWNELNKAIASNDWDVIQSTLKTKKVSENHGVVFKRANVKYLIIQQATNNLKEGKAISTHEVTFTINDKSKHTGNLAIVWSRDHGVWKAEQVVSSIPDYGFFSIDKSLAHIE